MKKIKGFVEPVSEEPRKCVICGGRLSIYNAGNSCWRHKVAGKKRTHVNAASSETRAKLAVYAALGDGHIDPFGASSGPCGIDAQITFALENGEFVE